MSRRVVGPFNRVEGDLEVQLEVEDGVVQSARVVSSLYRGFEQILHGKEPSDALVYAPRICGICSVAQSVAAASALAAATGATIPRNGQLATNLTLATENAADHLTHFYLFFMPDFARAEYQAKPWYDYALRRFQAVKGEAARAMLPARAQFLHLMGLLAGKWPHSLALQPGGTTHALEAQELIRIGNLLFAFRQFLETTLYGDRLETIAALDSAAQLQQWMAQRLPESSDFRFFLHLADDLALDHLGATRVPLMSYGVYPLDGEALFPRGMWQDGMRELDPALISEDVSHSWLAQQNGPKHPYDSATLPDVDAANGYSWCKAPRLDGAVMEVGALARQAIAGQPLVRELVTASGGNVRNRVIARLIELARLVLAMEEWVTGIAPKAPFCASAEVPDEGQGAGMIEAARGSLGHWLRIKHGRILNYQIIAPTTWNFSPQDQNGVGGALEQALVGIEVGDNAPEPAAVQHVVRSFDPCMVCTVH